MSDYIELFKNLNDNLKSLCISFGILFCFWIIPFCLFKPEIFNFPFYVQIALIFSLSVVWFFLSILFSALILMLFDVGNSLFFYSVSFIAILLLNTTILIGYYHSSSFTGFLQIALKLMIYGILVQMMLITISNIINEKKNRLIFILVLILIPSVSYYLINQYPQLRFCFECS